MAQNNWIPVHVNPFEILRTLDVECSINSDFSETVNHPHRPKFLKPIKVKQIKIYSDSFGRSLAILVSTATLSDFYDVKGYVKPSASFVDIIAGVKSECSELGRNDLCCAVSRVHWCSKKWNSCWYHLSGSQIETFSWTLFCCFKFFYGCKLVLVACRYRK